MIEPLVKTIEVPCSQERAFGIFVNEMDSWWPLSKYTVSAMAGGVARGLLVDPKQGGTIVEIGNDGSEHLWGTIESYNPHESVSMNFHIPQPGEVVNERSLVEVRFTALGDERTRVELTQTNWGGFWRDRTDAAWRLRRWLGRHLRAGLQGGLRRLKFKVSPDHLTRRHRSPCPAA